MNIQRISKLSGVLGVRLVKHEPLHVEEVCSSSDASVPLALSLSEHAVVEIGDCRLIYGGEHGVTVIGMRFSEVGITLLVAATTGHPVAKSLRRLMRSVAGLKRHVSTKDAA